MMKLSGSFSFSIFTSSSPTLKFRTSSPRIWFDTEKQLAVYIVTSNSVFHARVLHLWLPHQCQDRRRRKAGEDRVSPPHELCSGAASVSYRTWTECQPAVVVKTIIHCFIDIKLHLHMLYLVQRLQSEPINCSPPTAVHVVPKCQDNLFERKM